MSDVHFYAKRDTEDILRELKEKGVNLSEFIQNAITIQYKKEQKPDKDKLELLLNGQDMPSWYDDLSFIDFQALIGPDSFNKKTLIGYLTSKHELKEGDLEKLKDYLAKKYSKELDSLAINP